MWYVNWSLRFGQGGDSSGTVGERVESIIAEMSSLFELVLNISSPRHPDGPNGCGCYVHVKMSSFL